MDITADLKKNQKIMHLPQPKSFHLQWHITERCNLKCTHCYIDQKYIKEELEIAQLIDIFDQFCNLIKIWNIPKRMAIVSITGGEPLLNKHFWKLLDKCHKQKENITYNVLTNGTLIDRNIAKRLKKREINNIQVSLEGMETINDTIRGKGSFKKITDAIRYLKDEDLKVAVSTTIHKGNINDLKMLIDLCKDLKVNFLGASRIVPLGRGKQMKNLMLSEKELSDTYRMIKETNKKLKTNKDKLILNTGCDNSIWTAIDPEFQTHGCSAAYDSLTILPDGQVYPCRRLPIKVGDLNKNTLFDIWYLSEKLWPIRDQNNRSISCKSCTAFEKCKGGSKCVSYGYNNQLSKIDPQCLLTESNRIDTTNKTEKDKKENILPQLDSRYIISKKTEQPYSFDMNKNIKHININLYEKNRNAKISRLIKTKHNKYNLIITFNFDETDNNQNISTINKSEYSKKINSFFNSLKNNNIPYLILGAQPFCLTGLILKDNHINIPNMTIKKNIEIINNIPLSYIQNINQITEFLNYQNNNTKQTNINTNLLNKKCIRCRYLTRKKCKGIYMIEQQN